MKDNRDYNKEIRVVAESYIFLILNDPRFKDEDISFIIEKLKEHIN